MYRVMCRLFFRLAMIFSYLFIIYIIRTERRCFRDGSEEGSRTGIRMKRCRIDRNVDARQVKSLRERNTEMELSWNCLRERTETCRILIAYPAVSCDSKNVMSDGVRHFNRFSEELARKTAEGAGDASSIRTEGEGWLLHDRYISTLLRIFRFCNGSLTGFSCVSYSMDLKYGIILRLRDMITRDGMQKISSEATKYHGFYFDEKGVHLYICNFNIEEAAHCRVSQYGRFLQETHADYSFLKG